MREKKQKSFFNLHKVLQPGLQDCLWPLSLFFPPSSTSWMNAKPALPFIESGGTDKLRYQYPDLAPVSRCHGNMRIGAMLHRIRDTAVLTGIWTKVEARAQAVENC